MSKTVTLFWRYMVFAGATANVLLILSVACLYFYADQPLTQMVDRVSNYLAYQRGGTQQKVGKALIRFGLASDWDARAGQFDKHITRHPLLTAAHPEQQFPYQRYDVLGKPSALKTAPFLPPAESRPVYVDTPNALLAAVKTAQAGDIISLAPGNYRFSGRSIAVTKPGSADKPIYLRSEKLGTAVLELNTLEGFHVMAPFWVFENLEIQGVCGNDSRCEHAFHVTGNGRSFTLRNSKLINFNASIKVNATGDKGNKSFPDNGLLAYNLFANERPRKTGSPVTLLNINSVDNWVVRGNFIADFSKNGSDHISYGAFMKGGGKNGLFERNLVICEHRLAPDRGIRIGLSFGGGGTGAKYCRNNDCSSEHSDGVMRNNIVLNCSRDVGIYLNKASNTGIYNNLLHNTLGIDVRYATASATIASNIVSGRIKARDNAIVHQGDNLIDRDCLGNDRRGCMIDELYAAPELGDLRRTSIDPDIWGKGTTLDQVPDDFCGKPRGERADLGPIQYFQGLDCLQP